MQSTSSESLGWLCGFLIDMTWQTFDIESTDECSHEQFRFVLEQIDVYLLNYHLSTLIDYPLTLRTSVELLLSTKVQAYPLTTYVKCTSTSTCCFSVEVFAFESSSSAWLLICKSFVCGRN